MEYVEILFEILMYFDYMVNGNPIVLILLALISTCILFKRKK